MKKKTLLDKEDKDLFADHEHSAFRPVKNRPWPEKKPWKPSGVTRRGVGINIRVSTADLEMLKQRATEEGLPYQILITSILHKYVSRTAPQTN